MSGHGSLFSLGERDTPPDNHKLAASWQRNEPPLVATDLYRQSLYKSVACQTSSYARDQYNPFQEHHWRRFIYAVKRNALCEWFWGQTMKLRVFLLLATPCVGDSRGKTGSWEGSYYRRHSIFTNIWPGEFMIQVQNRDRWTKVKNSNCDKTAKIKLWQN